MGGLIRYSQPFPCLVKQLSEKFSVLPWHGKYSYSPEAKNIWSDAVANYVEGIGILEEPINYTFKGN